MEKTWVIVSSEENFGISKSHGFSIQGLKSRHRQKAQQVQPGDHFIYYITGLQVLAGIVSVKSTYFEDETLIWNCGKRPGEERYPFRFKIEPDLILAPSQYLPVEPLHTEIQYLQKWPEKHWRLGFQGNIHLWTPDDAALVRQQMEKRLTLSVSAS